MDDSLNRGRPAPHLASSALTINLEHALLRSDPQHERLFLALTGRPLTLLRLVAALPQGREAFRAVLQREAGPGFRLSSCPRAEEVERLVENARSQGKPVDWVSREPLRLADEDEDIRRLLGQEREVLDARGDVERQVERLRALHPEGFAYVGRHADDLPFWRAASERYGVDLPAVVRRQAEREGLGIVEIARRRPFLPSLLRSMRPHQWLKNLLVFVPFGLSLGQLGAPTIGAAVAAFVCLCLLTSGTYLVNDMFDVEADRRHPRKRKRPIAAGDVPIPAAATSSLLLVAVALAVGFLLRPIFAAVLGAYLVVTLAYSFKLKRMAMVDVLVIAVLFTLRILAGMVMINASSSHWLLIFSIFFFLSLAFMKREVEFNVMHRAGRQSLSGRGYAMEDRMYVLSCGLSSGMASIVIFALFISETTSLETANYGAPVLLWVVMFCLSYWVLRMWLLTTRGLMNDDPILFAARDRTSLLLGGASALLTLAAQALHLMSARMREATSWGRVNRTVSDIAEPRFLDEARAALGRGRPALPRGLGRSYGDVCLNDGGTLVSTERLDRLVWADWESGVVRAEAGLTIGGLLELAVPRGWFVPVTPGTKAVTLGGAVANDVHGKNHHEAGTFGCHVRALSLRRTGGQVLEIGPDRDVGLFAATVGGLGLTGLILEVELQLHRIASSDFEAETLRLGGLDDFFRTAEASLDWPYTVAWVDCLARGAALGRGLFNRGRHAGEGPLQPHGRRRSARVPLDAPAALLGPTTVRLFNAAYARQPLSGDPRRMPYEPFLYPLDGIGDWNRLYGARGFFQHQSVVPMRSAQRALKRLLEMTSAAGQGSFLVVLKLFGPRPSPGLLSFPEEGATFALDLPNRGDATRALLARMADITLEEGGRLYPAKDATMSADHFRAGYPRWREVEAMRDPGILSDFWRRVTRDAA